MEDQERSNGVDRRKFIKGAATVAWATPLVLTVGATSAHAQVPSPPNCLGGRPPASAGTVRPMLRARDSGDKAACWG